MTVPLTGSTCDTTLLCNQEFPEAVCRISFSSATTADPLTWVDFSSRLRSFQIESGSSSELDAIDPGTATVVLDNRDRALDPFNTSSTYSPNVKPRRRLWMQSYWAGECKDQFYGWTGSFQPGWVANTDAVVTVEAQDGLSVLSRAHLPVTDPPRDTYADLVLSERPYIFLPFDDAVGSVQVNDASGNGRSSDARTAPFVNPTFGIGPLLNGDAGTSCLLGTTSRFDWATGVGDFAGASSVGVDGWFASSASPWIAEFLGPTTTTYAAPDFQYGLKAGSATGVTAYLATSTAKYALNVASTFIDGDPYHVAMRWDGANLKVYVNGAEVGTMAATGTLQPADGTSPTLFDGQSAFVQHWAVYPALSAAQILEHYEGGTSQGLGIDSVRNRVDDILGNVTSYGFIPRRIRGDASSIQGTYFHGQTAREEMDRTMPVAGDPAMFFIAKDGAAVFLDSAHRSTSPWDTVQATFDDDGTDLKYLNLELDDGVSFIRNTVRGTARPVTQTGATQSASDSTSIADYGPVVLDLGETLYQVEADLAAEVAALLAKYKDPIPRITAIHLEGSHNSGLVQTQILNRELGDKVRVFRRPVGGGSAIDQSSWIRKRSLSGSTGNRWWQGTWELSSRRA